MAITYELLTSQTISTGTSTISLSSISQSYTDLRLVLSHRPSAVPLNANFTFNSDTGSNYTRESYWSTGASYGVSTSYATTQIAASYGIQATSNLSLTTLDIFDYSRTNHAKGCLLQQSSTNSSSVGVTERGFGLWNSNTAISSIQIGAGGGTWNTGTVIALYGILKA